MTENPPPPPPGTPEGGGTPPPPPPQNPYQSQPSAPPPPPQNPYGSVPPPPSQPYAGNPPNAGQAPYGASPYPTAPTPGPGPAPVAGMRPGGLGERFLARLIDMFSVGIVVGIIQSAVGYLVGGIIGGILYLGYFAYMESSRGRTLGKQILKLRVLGPTGGNPTMEESLRRNAWLGLYVFSGFWLIGIFTGLLEFIAIIAIAVTIQQDAVARRGWHDKFGNTSVVKEG